ncbi:MAG: peroxiredoxin, partial [Flammeovirgaceae bacterium]|nr:peroxiredoxin [Flammeovirgaceae bacterium]MDW8288247.1 peroxiredoxin [Flammeovirgaceae bacterium]
MALPVGTKAPDFKLPSTTGQLFSLSEDLKNMPCVLYFYPKDFTSGCTKEACSFRDAYDQFKTLGIRIIGISRDSIETHLKFKKHYNLPFELLCDADGKVTKLYDAKLPIINLPARITYLLDESHTIIGRYDSLFDAYGH